MKGKVIDEGFISRLEALTLHMNNPMKGYFGGNHRTRSYGSTVEFADFREYTLGDDIRHIDWNLFSRFEKHFIKLFVDERQMLIEIFVDCSASMERIDEKKAGFALRTAAAIGYLSVQGMDKTSLKLIYGDSAESLAGTMIGKDSFFRGMGRLEDVKFSGSADIEKAVIEGAEAGFCDGLTVIISDFLTDSDWKKAVDFLIYKKRQVMLIQVLSPDEIDPLYSGRVSLKDSEADNPLDGRNLKLKINKNRYMAYKAALSDFLGDLKDFCASRGAIFITARSDEPVEGIIFENLYQTGTVK